MIDTVAGLRLLISDFVSGTTSFETLDGAIARLGEIVDAKGPLVLELWGRVELLLAERSSGHLDDSELRYELAELVAPVIDVGPRGTTRQFVTASRSFTTRVGVVVLWPAPGADTRVVTARA